MLVPVSWHVGSNSGALRGKIAVSQEPVHGRLNVVEQSFFGNQACVMMSAAATCSVLDMQHTEGCAVWRCAAHGSHLPCCVARGCACCIACGGRPETDEDV